VTTAAERPAPSDTPEPSADDHRRPSWRAVALPSEHGGWSLTAEPAVLGLIVAFSGAGLALAGAAMLAFVARTPLKVVLVDRWRHRWLDRSRLALRIAVVEVAVLLALVAVAVATTDHRFWPPLAIAAPLVLLELWYDMRSRSRRLIPEIAGTIGIGSVAAAVALAGGTSGLVAAGLWCVVAARSVAAVAYVRCQIMRSHSRPAPRWQSDIGQVAALTAVGIGWVADAVPAASVAAIALLGIFNAAALTRPPSRAVVIGIQQTIFGLFVVAVTAIAVLAA
jgi:hypothetical protein